MRLSNPALPGTTEMTKRKTKDGATTSPTALVNDDGSLTLRGKRIAVPGVRLEEVIGCGANGIVVKGRHRLLSKPLAVKFWVSLRRHDSRDKMAQGLAEVQKLFETEHYHAVVRIRDCGEAEGVFYSVMDHFPGQTLDAWLEDLPPLGLRRLVAIRLVDDVCAHSHLGIYHGDLHAGNLLVDTRVASLLDGREPRFGIIDFGTSLFSGKGASQARHWRVFTKTLDQLLKPFELRTLSPTPFPATASPRSIRSWYQTSLIAIRHVLIRLGADWLIDPEETHDFHKQEWATRDLMLGELFPASRQTLETVRGLVKHGAVVLSPEWLGPGKLWWPRPGHSATIDELDEREIGWTTSRTDKAWWLPPRRR